MNKRPAGRQGKYLIWILKRVTDSNDNALAQSHPHSPPNYIASERMRFLPRTRSSRGASSFRSDNLKLFLPPPICSSHPRRRFASVIRGARCRPRKNTPIFLSLGNKKCCCRQRRRRRPSTTGRPRPRPGGRTEKRTIDARKGRASECKCVVRHVTVH